MGLTPKQEKFVQGLFRGLSQRQAYKEAFENSANWKDNTIDSRASELANDSEVLGRLTELQTNVTKESNWTIHRLIQEFEELKELTKAEKEYQVTAKSLENIGKLLGMYKDRVEHSGSVPVMIVDDIK
jgi:phage terminase small subunit